MERQPATRPFFRGTAEERLMRLARWCIQRSRRDDRLARARGRWLGSRNVARLAKRRWAQLCPDDADSGAEEEPGP